MRSLISAMGRCRLSTVPASSTAVAMSAGGARLISTSAPRAAADPDSSNPTAPLSGPLEQLARSIQRAHLNNRTDSRFRSSSQQQRQQQRPSGTAEGGQPSGNFVETRRMSDNAMRVTSRKAVVRRQLQNHLEWGTYTTPDLMEFEEPTRTRRKKPALFAPRRHIAEKYDPFFQLGLNPKKPSLFDDSYKNVTLLAPYVSRMGKIHPRSETRLVQKNQRRVTKAIKRARAMLLMPVLARPHKYNNYGWGDKWTFQNSKKH